MSDEMKSAMDSFPKLADAKYVVLGNKVLDLDKAKEHIEYVKNILIPTLLKNQDNPLIDIIREKPYIYTTEVKTMATDGNYILINPFFSEEMFKINNGGGIAFVLIHEAFHILYNHISEENNLGEKFGGSKELHNKSNIAQDYEINYDIERCITLAKKDKDGNVRTIRPFSKRQIKNKEGIIREEPGMTKKANGLYDEKYKGRNWYDIFDMLDDIPSNSQDNEKKVHTTADPDTIQGYEDGWEKTMSDAVSAGIIKSPMPCELTGEAILTSITKPSYRNGYDVGVEMANRKINGEDIHGGSEDGGEGEGGPDMDIDVTVGDDTIVPKGKKSPNGESNSSITVHGGKQEPDDSDSNDSDSQSSGEGQSGDDNQQTSDSQPSDGNQQGSEGEPGEYNQQGSEGQPGSDTRSGDGNQQGSEERPNSEGQPGSDTRSGDGNQQGSEEQPNSEGQPGDDSQSSSNSQSGNKNNSNSQKNSSGKQGEKGDINQQGTDNQKGSNGEEGSDDKKGTDGEDGTEGGKNSTEEPMTPENTAIEEEGYDVDKLGHDHPIISEEDAKKIIEKEGYDMVEKEREAKNSKTPSTSTLLKGLEKLLKGLGDDDLVKRKIKNIRARIEGATTGFSWDDVMDEVMKDIKYVEGDMYNKTTLSIYHDYDYMEEPVEKKVRVAVFVDTSGSVAGTPDKLERIAGDIMDAAENYSNIIECLEVYGFANRCSEPTEMYTNEPHNDLSFDTDCGGSEDYDVACSRILSLQEDTEHKYAAAIVITDDDITWGGRPDSYRKTETEIPQIWVVLSEGYGKNMTISDYEEYAPYNAKVFVASKSKVL